MCFQEEAPPGFCMALGQGSRFKFRRQPGTSTPVCRGPSGIGPLQPSRTCHGPASMQVLVDTAVFSPVHILGYFAVMNAGEGGSWRALEAKVRTDFVPTLAAELAVWPALQAANFKYIRVDYQLLAVNLVTILGELCLVPCCCRERMHARECVRGSARGWMQRMVRRVCAIVERPNHTALLPEPNDPDPTAEHFSGMRADSAFMSWCRATDDWVAVVIPGWRGEAGTQPKGLPPPTTQEDA